MRYTFTVTRWRRTQRSGEDKIFPLLGWHKYIVKRDPVLYPWTMVTLYRRTQDNKNWSSSLENCSSGNGKATCWCGNILFLAHAGILYSSMPEDIYVMEECKMPAWAREKIFPEERFILISFCYSVSFSVCFICNPLMAVRLNFKYLL
jgi:hypothetical protein